ncbi:hypothetical protein [Consotaella salsifontis]|uniref:Uncharacterized protein n=1 Tax=Consotaella salsifontis TaxID=1365950 RepID=A0A1T4LCA2_9HYPH|nr:hypothetical protein [Consotaella salsifontis]SJZ52178.1 hypothetical protein SAMN05428963_101150 [Consotaella salsifontis]
MFAHRAMALALLVLGVAATALAARADDLTYHNSRYGTSATFPVEAFPNRMPSPTNGDGMAWTSNDGAELYIYARANTGGETPASIVAKRADDDEVTYRRTGKTWAVVSGYRKDKIFYERYILRGDLIHSVAIRYPRALRDTYDDLVGPVTMTLRGKGS